MSVTVFIGSRDWFKGQAGRVALTHRGGCLLVPMCPFGGESTVHQVQRCTHRHCWILSTWLQVPEPLSWADNTEHPWHPHREGVVRLCELRGLWSQVRTYMASQCSMYPVTHSHHESLLVDARVLRAVQDYFQESTEHVFLGLRRRGEKRNLVSCQVS